MISLSPYEQKTLEILRDRGKFDYTSAVGFVLLELTEGADRKPNPSPQGAALFAGRFLGPLQRRGRVSGYKGWSITKKGLEALAEHDKPAADGAAGRKGGS